jgi:hypothetical protein
VSARGNGQRAKTSSAENVNVDAERAVLGAMLVGGEGQVRAAFEAGLLGDHFGSPRTRTVFEAIGALREKGSAVEVLTVTEELSQLGQLADLGGGTVKKGRDYVAGCAATVPNPGNAAQYAHIVMQRAGQRAWQAAGRRIVNLEAEPGDEEIRRLLDEAERITAGGGNWSDRRALSLDRDAEPDPPDYLIADRIERGTITALAGDTGAAKSWVAQSLQVATVERRDHWLGYELRARHGRAVAIDEENPERLVRSRLRALGLRDGSEGLRYFHRLGVQLGEGDWIDWLRGELLREPADLLTIDTAATAVAAEINDNDAVTAFFRGHLRPLADETGVAIMLLLHERKPPTQGPRGPRTMATMGARQWIGQADTQLMLSRRGEPIEEELPDDLIRRESRFTLEVGKLRDGGRESKEIVCVTSTLTARRALREAEVVNEGDAEREPTTVDRVEALLRRTPGMTMEALREETDRAERTIRDALRQLDAEDDGKNPKRYRLPAGAQEELLP